MADSFKEYVVSIDGLPHTFLLSPEQARERGLTDADLVNKAVKAAPAPANKARAAESKSNK